MTQGEFIRAGVDVLKGAVPLGVFTTVKQRAAGDCARDSRAAG